MTNMVRINGSAGEAISPDAIALLMPAPDRGGLLDQKDFLGRQIKL